jgi:hypothetical protein
MFLLLGLLTVGSGALRWLHEIVHPADHHHHGIAVLHEHGDPVHHGEHPDAPLPHDESHCVLVALLKLPMLGAGAVPVLLYLGLFAAFLLRIPASAPRSRRPVLPLDSRGPPALRPRFQPA